VAPLLLARWAEIATPGGFQQVLRFEMVPEAQRGLGELLGAACGQPRPELARLIQAYQAELNDLVEPLQARATRQDAQLGDQIRAVIQPYMPDGLRDESLSRVALDFVASTPGVTCVLCGMRQPAYVDDAVGVMTLPPISDVPSMARALATATRLG
jgi:hypothetical protein